jgi:hypothetical protein
MHVNRYTHTASLLPNGKILVAGGMNYNDTVLNSAELYDPTTSNLKNAGNIFVTAEDRTALVLKNGNGFISDNELSNGLQSNISMLYNSSMETFTSSDNIENLQSSNKILMSANEKVSVIDKENFTTSKNKQLH